MPHSWRFLRPVLLVTLLLTMIVPQSFGLAQDEGSTAIVVAGSFQPQVQAMLEGVRDAYVAENADAQIDLALEGSQVGLRSLCVGDSDLAISTEPIGEALTATELTNCVEAPNFIETVWAYESVVLVAPPAAEVTCLPKDQITADVADSITGLWTIGAPAEAPWTNVLSPLTTNIEFYGPDEFSLAYQTFANLMPSGDLREGITTVEPADIITAVQAEASSVMGFMSLADWQTANPGDESVSVIGVQSSSTSGCVAPALETIEDRSYALSRTVYVYVNAASLEKVQPFMEFALSSEQGVLAQAPAQGFTAPSEATLQTGISNMTTPRTGRTFSRPVSPVSQSPDVLFGVVDVAGSAMLYNTITNPVITALTQAYPGVMVNTATLGNSAGWDSLCAAENAADALASTRAFSAAELAACNTPYELNLGADALVLVAPASLEGVSCVDSDQVQGILGVYTPPIPEAAPVATEEAAPAGATEEAPAASATEEAAPVATEEAPAPAATEEAAATEEPLPAAPALWSDVNSDWPAVEILAVLPPRSSGETDYLGASLFGTQRFVTRTDGLESDDPLYRAQGVMNTNNGFTYVWWSDLQGGDIDANLLEVDAGNGCVAPTAETITDGSYPLSYPVRIYVNQTSLSDPAVRAFLWQFFTDSILDQLAESSFVGLDMEALRGETRDAVYNMLAALDVVVEEPAPAATEEPEVSATEEAAPAATEEAAPVATEPAPVVTEEPVPAATAEATAEATQAAQ